MKKVRKKLIREQAVIAIYQYLLSSTREEIELYLKENTDLEKNPDEWKLVKQYIETTIQNYDQYAKQIDLYLKEKWSVDRLSKMELAILLIAVYELLDLDENKTVVINEAVELSKKYCDLDAYKYINAVLHAII